MRMPRWTQVCSPLYRKFLERLSTQNTRKTQAWATVGQVAPDYHVTKLSVDPQGKLLTSDTLTRRLKLEFLNHLSLGAAYAIIGHIRDTRSPKAPSEF